MTKRKRLYEKRGRFYADFVDFADVGGKKEALIPPGARPRQATTDGDEALRLMSLRLEELKTLRRGGGKPTESPVLWDYAVRHLALKEKRVAASTIERDERSLRIVCAYFSEGARLSDITVETLTDYVQHRSRAPGQRKGTTTAAQTQLHELNALSSLFSRAVSEGRAEFNPVSRLQDKPRIERDEAVYLEVDEAARLIKAAYQLDATPRKRAIAHLGPLLETGCYTGARAKALLGLEVRDIDFKNEVVHLRPNQWRGIKRHQRRTVRLWRRHKKGLRAYLNGSGITSGLLFPSDSDGMWEDIRGSIDKAVELAGIEKRVTLKTLRHTFGATRIQTLDHGAPISLYTVAKEMGHRGIAMIEKHYGHLQNVRHRKPVLEYVDNVVAFQVAKGA